MTSAVPTEWRPGADPDRDLDGLADVLHATVHAGASVGFVLPFALDEARAFWSDRVLPGVRSGSRRLWLAKADSRIVGTVQLILDTMPNQRHRAEIAKLLVHPDARRLGIGRALMYAAEDAARAERRTLLTLDTRTGDSAEPLYRSLGYFTAGVIPGYARHPSAPELEATTVMYKVLGER
jgi:ribosomal protein S18 acetylase RimI-like enzyme